MKSRVILIPLILLSSCKLGGSNLYYQSLRDECTTKNEYEQTFCNQSIDIMEKHGYKKAEKRANTYSCPDGSIVDGIKSVGAVFYCRPE